MAMVVRGVVSLGFRTKVVPAAGATFQEACSRGWFQGAMSAHTPIGSWTTRLRTSGPTSTTRPPSLSATSPK